jgi:phage terminase large subunit-like protein
MIPVWSTAVPDWESRIVAGQSLITFPPLFPKEAKAARDVFDDLIVADVMNQPRIADISRPWLLDFVSAVFGAYDTDAGRRLITEFFMLISKKNSKSTTAAGIMLTALIRNWRASAEFLIVAPTIEIANNSFYPARDMVKNDPALNDLLHLQEHTRTITHRLTEATLKVIAADNETVGGKKASGILIDELWLFGKRANAENMLREATGGLASRPEGFVIYLSTQSDEPPAGVFKSKLQYARDVRDGRILDPKFLPVLYEFPELMIRLKQYLSPKNFYITNPNIGASVDTQYLEHEFGKARATNDQSSLRGFLAKNLNVEIGMALRSDRWTGADFWEQNASPTRVTIEVLLKECEVICVGIDGGGLDDMLGFGALGRKPDGNLLLWNHAWIHPIVLERRQQEETKFRDFARDGDLTIVSHIGQDVDEVAQLVKRIEAAGVLDNIGVDQAGIGAIVDAIVKTKIQDAEKRIIGIPQGWRLVGAIKTTERYLAASTVLKTGVAPVLGSDEPPLPSRTLTHQGSPLMNYCVSNARAEPRGNAVLITKQGSGAGKIDPLLATFDAMTLMSENPKPRKKKYQAFFV